MSDADVQQRRFRTAAYVRFSPAATRLGDAQRADIDPRTDLVSEAARVFGSSSRRTA